MTKEEEEYLRSLAVPQQIGEIDLPGRVQSVIDRLGNIDGLEKKAVMLEMQANGQNPLPSYLGLGQGQAQQQPSGPMARWGDAPEQGGLGLASRQMEPQAIGRPSLGEYLGAQTFPGVELSYFQKNRLVNAALEPEMLAKRATLAQQLQAQEEKRREQEFSDFLSLDKQLGQDPEQWDAQMKLMAAKGNPHARVALQVGDKKMMGEYQSVLPLVDTYYPDFAKKYGKDPSSVSKSEMRAVLNNVGKIKERRALADADAQEEAALDSAYQSYLKTGAGLNPGDAERLIELRNKREKQQLELEKLRLGNKKLEKEATGTDQPKVTQMAQELSMELFDKPWEGLDQAQRVSVEKEKEKRLQGRTAGMIAQGLPQPVEKRSNVINRKEFLKTGALVMPPGGTTKNQIDSGDYIEITDKQKEAWGEVVNSGTTLKALFDMVDPLITAKTSGQAMKQYAQLSIGAVSKKNPSAATYLADSEAFSSRMARVFGSEVGVLTQGDVERWKRALPTFSDTVGVKEAKKKVFMDIYNQSRAMAIKKLAGEDISADQDKLRKGPLAQIDKVAPTTVDEDFDLLMGGK